MWTWVYSPTELQCYHMTFETEWGNRTYKTENFIQPWLKRKVTLHKQCNRLGRKTAGEIKTFIFYEQRYTISIDCSYDTDVWGKGTTYVGIYTASILMWYRRKGATCLKRQGVRSKGAFLKGGTHTFVSFHNATFVRGDLPNKQVESHAGYIQREELMW